MRPFDKNGSGLVLGEGAAFFVLVRASDAQRRRAGVAQLTGIGLIQDYCPAAANRWAPDDLRSVIAEANIDAGDCDCVVAHGMGITEVDAYEAAAWSDVLPTEVPVTAFKGLTGYLGTATAAVELALTILCLRAGFVSAVAGLNDPGSNTGIDLVMGKSRIVSRASPAAVLISRSWAGSISSIAIRT